MKQVLCNEIIRFKNYQAGTLYYETESGFVFSVPKEDLDRPLFNATERALFFTRYINKELGLSDNANSQPP